MARHDAVSVANAVIEAAGRQGLPVTPMQLQKLLYFANGWNLEIRCEPLIAENFEAWQFGPVLPSVYHAFKEYGSRSIAAPALNPFTLEAWSADLTRQESALIDEVVQIYGKLTGPQLSQLTHQAGTSWSKIWEGGVGKSDTIPPELISKEFRSMREASDKDTNVA